MTQAAVWTRRMRGVRRPSARPRPSSPSPRGARPACATAGGPLRDRCLRPGGRGERAGRHRHVGLRAASRGTRAGRAAQAAASAAARGSAAAGAASSRTAPAATRPDTPTGGGAPADPEAAAVVARSRPRGTVRDSAAASSRGSTRRGRKPGALAGPGGPPARSARRAAAPGALPVDPRDHHGHDRGDRFGNRLGLRPLTRRSERSPRPRPAPRSPSGGPRMVADVWHAALGAVTKARNTGEAPRSRKMRPPIATAEKGRWASEDGGLRGTAGPPSPIVRTVRQPHPQVHAAGRPGGSRPG